MRYYFIAFICVVAGDNFYGNYCCKSNSFSSPEKNSSSVSLIVLGTIQDAGSPQIGCTKVCCKDLFAHPDNKERLSLLGLLITAPAKHIS